MPGVDGNEAARKNPGGGKGGEAQKTPIIGLTAGVMDSEGSPSRSPVFDDWVYKPFSEAEMIEKLRNTWECNSFTSRPQDRRGGREGPGKIGRH